MGSAGADKALVCVQRSDGRAQEVSRLLLEDGTMQYENQSTNYGVLGAMGGMAGAGVAGFAGYGGLLGAGLGFDHLSGLAVGGGGLGGVGGGLGLAADSGGAPPGISFKLAIAESSVGWKPCPDDARCMRAA